MSMQYVLVTGATAGTGLAIARRFLQAGYGVYISSRRAEDARKTAASLAEEYQLPVQGFRLDPAEGEAGVSAIFAEIDDLHALVLNSANLGMTPSLADPLTLEIAEWAEVINTNVIWNFALARHAARRMRAHSGAIVFIGSNTSRRAIAGRSAYIASKGAISSLSKALAMDLAPYGIRVNCLMPGMIGTIRWDARSAAEQEMSKRHIPLGKVASYDEIAEGAFFLAHSATQSTGTDMIIDGGVDGRL
jgi:NAD(P)-dependent dehydrogenase (short-subunit alcohol dehydrogenase family)